MSEETGVCLCVVENGGIDVEADSGVFFSIDARMVLELLKLRVRTDSNV